MPAFNHGPNFNMVLLKSITSKGRLVPLRPGEVI
jgi:hypothetical protein